MNLLRMRRVNAADVLLGSHLQMFGGVLLIAENGRVSSPSGCTGMKERWREEWESGKRGKILIKQGLCIDSALCIRQKVKQMPGQRCHFKQ